MRRKGQNFLVDGKVLQRIADYARLGPSDRVLEIGPGTGNLTEVLSRTAGRVYAIEADRSLAASLEGRFDNVEVIPGDALKVELPSYNKIVSNLPYQISSKITYRILQRPFDLAVLMYQKEFAKRMVAPARSDGYGRLSMIVGFYANAEILENVPRTAFRPVPQVSSSIVRLHPQPGATERVAFDHFMKLATGLFSHRRKKLTSALEEIGVPKEDFSGLEKSLLDRRPQELGPEEAGKLAKKINFLTKR
jgi:16S rRNA (adenine1518-N6/adenine1519-N6)-dimethyltransferase